MGNIELIAKSINIISDFLSRRDIESLTKESLYDKYKLEQVDLIIIFGGCIPYSYDLVGNAIKEGIAKKLMIVGGAGHTTEALRNSVRSRYNEIETKDKMEADIIYDYLKLKFNIKESLIERNSTNCGNNVSYSLNLLEEEGYYPESIIIVQDGTMQLRMDATFKKLLNNKNVKLINYAGYKNEIVVEGNKLKFKKDDMWGMWDINHYITLLMGEIKRLNDNEEGYGPRGRNFIAHVEIPLEVYDAFDYLRKYYSVREANEKYK